MRWAAVGCVTLAVLVAAPSALAAPTLTILAPETLSVHLSTTKGSGAGTATVVVRNDAGTDATNLRFRAEGKDSTSITVTSDVHQVAPHAALSVPLTFASDEADVSFSGVLVASTDGRAEDAVALTVDRSEPAAWWLWIVILGPLGAAAAVVWVAWRRHKRAYPDASFRHRFGDASWDFQKSWSSNLTVIGGILATTVASGALPSEVAKSTRYAGLGLLFAVLALVAPFAFAATKDASGGFVWAFLITSLITLWATFGQLTTAYLLFGELQTDTSLPGFTTWLLLGIAIGAAVLLAVYAVNSIASTLDQQEAMFNALAAQPSWSLL
jgi:hypothetical protein